MESAADSTRKLKQSSMEGLDCPRCGSSNTKFCYYNNYNKSQPRYFCKACKRHWTKGGTLRNVPLGGARRNNKNKRLNPTVTATTTTDRKKINNILQQNSHDHYFSLPIPAPHDERKKKNISDIFYRALIINSSSPASSSSVQLPDSKSKTSSLMLPLPCSTTTPSSSSSQDDQNLQFSFSNLSPLDNIPSPIPTNFQQYLNGYYINDEDYYRGVESSTVTTTTTAATTSSAGMFCQPPPWQLLGPLTTTSSSIGMAELQNYSWNWNEIDTLVSADLNIPWDDNYNNTEIKP